MDFARIRELVDQLEKETADVVASRQIVTARQADVVNAQEIVVTAQATLDAAIAENQRQEDEKTAKLQELIAELQTLVAVG